MPVKKTNIFLFSRRRKIIVDREWTGLGKTERITKNKLFEMMRMHRKSAVKFSTRLFGQDIFLNNWFYIGGPSEISYLRTVITLTNFDIEHRYLSRASVTL